MKLTKLEIRGFKSFGDKITINFDEGVTAIVGPNGCGKSNVVDAIRWVLGEQSTRALRSEKMENIIFNGSKSRKASNLAEVSLSFENSKDVLPTEFTEVTITRKLYRSGESEYRLNDVNCRLKDITDLFLDTGIGSDSYSIIELKMVEEIISNKEGSRRSLFEEAAGISKYKVRKKQTFHKLKDTEDDLSRVEDLLFEIEKNLKTLESQARRTERYYKLKEQYKELSIQLASFKIKFFDRSVIELESSRRKHQDEKIELNAALDKTEAELEKLKLDSVNKEKNLITQQKTVHEFSSRILEYENQKKIKNEKIRNLEERASRLQRELQTDQTALLVGGSELKLLLEKIEPESARLKQIEQDLPDYKEKADSLRSQVQRMRTELEATQKKANELAQILLSNEKEVDHFSVQAETLRTEMNRSELDRENRERELNEMVLNLDDLGKLIQAKNEILAEKTNREISLLEETVLLEEEIQTSKNQIAGLNRTLDAKQNEYKLTKSLVDNLEGFPDSIRFLKKNADWIKQAPLLSDILFCKEEYRVPIENFIEPYMNYYVVNTYEDAFKAVQLLGNAEKGRAHFFILEAFPEPGPAADRVVPASAIPALSILEVDQRYKALAHFLFKNVFIGKSEPSMQLQSGTDSVFLDQLGRFVHSAVHLSGGSIGLFEGKRIGRAKNLEVLLKEIKSAENALGEFQKDQEELQENLLIKRSELSQLNIKPLSEEIGRINSSQYGLQAKKEQFELFLKSNLERKEDIAAQLNLITSKSNELAPQIQLLNDDRQVQINQIQSQQEQIQEMSEELNEASARFNEQNIFFHQQQNKVQGLEKDLEYKSAHQESIDSRIGLNRAELESLQTSLSEISLHTDDSDTELISLYQQKNEMEKGLREIEEEYYRSKSDISGLEQKSLDIRRRREHTDVLILAVNEKLNQLQLELHGLRERLSVEFSLKAEDLILDEQETTEPEEELRLKNEKIKTTIDTFGAINPLAMEAFKEMDERYQFIKVQKEDLLQAKKSLLETIQEIDDTAKGKFLESFNLIRENFIQVFRSLFNEEDSCDLILTEPDNPLESDIDILARPKGKRPLTINQLSGGEKTLTATAILFSLYLLKPAPFCIFDEVDAPLDDTNIDKFNKIIRKFSNDSQFIVVTHNKRTIASTDVIYGITMVEAGISRVVPVDLRNVESAA